jgi:diguanylate cyclase (GGDEF)-like protein
MHRLRSPKSRRTGPHTALHLVRPSHLTLVPPSAAPVHAADAVSAHEVPLPLDPYAGGALRIERARPFTEQEQHLLATVAASLTLALRNAEAYQQIQDAALRDPLTGALNRRALDGPLMRELRAGLRYGMPACLLLLDLDYFKAVNDLLGHVAGDDVLKRVAALIQETVREVDSVGRYGGEEFAVVLPHTDLNQAQALAERLRSIIERHAFELEDGQVRTTASIGLASLDDPAIATASDWIEAADSALYEAKSRGRNRVVTHAPRNSAPACAAAMCAA